MTRELLRRIRMLFHRSQFQSELDEEMRLHLELREQEQREAGLPATTHIAKPTSASATPPSSANEASRPGDGAGSRTSRRTSRTAIRSMLRSPALTAVALLSLGLGIGANTAIFSFIDAIMLRSLPVKDPVATRSAREGTG